MCTFAQARQPTRRGAAVVELALLLPLLAGLVVGMFEISRGIMVKEFLSHASQKACRTAALPSKSNAAVLAEVADIMAESKVTGHSVTILVNGVAGDVKNARRNDQVSVKVSVPVSRVYWLTTFFLPASAVESETVVMLRQG